MRHCAATSTLRTVLLLVVAGAGALGLTGCLTAREAALERAEPENRFLALDAVLDGRPLGAGELQWRGQWARTAEQDIYLFMLARQAQLQPRYHGRTDLTIVCLRGGAVVEVEGLRKFLTPPAVATVPRLRTYSIIPNDDKEDFAALLIYSPQYDAGDVTILRGNR